MQPVDELTDFFDPLIHAVVDFFLVLGPQYYIGCALALLFAVAFPLSVHQSQYNVILAVALSQVVLSLSCICALVS